MDLRRKWNEEEYEEEIDLIPILKWLWHCARLILTAALVAGLLGLLGAAISYSPVYTTSFVIYEAKNASTYAELITSDSVLDEASRTEGLSYAYSDLNSLVSADVDSSSNRITVTVNGKSAEDALKLAQAVEAAAADRIAEVIRNASMKVIEEPQPAARSNAPSYKKTALIAAFLGAFCAAGVIALIEVFAGRVHNGAQLTESYGLAVVGAIPPEEAKKQPKILAFLRRINSPWFKKAADVPRPGEVSPAEAYDALAASLAMLLPGTEGKAIALTDADGRAHRGAAAMEIGASLARRGNKVIVVDCDMAAPSIANAAEIDERPGLSDYLTGADSIEAHVRREADSNVDELPSGSQTPDPSWLLASERMAELVDSLRKEYNYVLLALPPVTALSSVAPISKYTDGFLVAVAHEQTRTRRINDTMRILDAANSAVLGFIYNDAPASEMGKYCGK